jgi:putative ABC transport system permease protein
VVNDARGSLVIKVMDTAARDVGYAIRSLLRMRGVAPVAILTLALGIGATTTMFSVVYAMVLRPPPFADPERLVILFNTRATPRDGLQRLRWSMANIAALERTATSFESIGSFSGPLFILSGQGEPQHVDGETVSRAYFDALRVSPIAGRLFTAAESATTASAPVVIVGARLWMRKLAGERSAIGRTIVVNDVPLTIVGILPDGFSGLSGKAQLWIPPAMAARLYYAEYLTTPQNFISVVARLKNRVTLRQANAELAAIGSRFVGNGSAPDTRWGAAAVPLREARVDPALRDGAFALFAAAACVLLIACVNVAGLLLARARMRRREIAVRLAIGSSRGRLLRQLLTEGMVMAAVAGACGTVFAWWGARLLARTAPSAIASSRNNYAALGAVAPPALDPMVLLFAVAIAIGTTLLFALAPALAASRPELVTALKENDRGGRRGHSMAVLVVSEIAIACLLLSASGMLIERFARLQNRRSGFVSDDVLTFWVRPPGSRYPPANGPATLDRLLSRVQTVPGVESAAVNRCVPFTGCANTILFLADRPVDPANAPGVGRHYISPDYFRTLGIPIVAGRGLTAADRAGSPPVAIVNEGGARRFWPGENPIGKRVWFGTTTGPFSDAAHAVEIVGVAGDVKYGGADQPDRVDRADFYTSYLQFAYPDTMFIVKTRGAATALLPALRTAVASVDPALPIYDAMTLDDGIAAAIAQPRFNAALLGAFAAAALLLAALGVYGVLSYSVSSRMRDIGVRLALGADGGRVVRMILTDGLRLAAGGVIAGLAASFAIGRIAGRILLDSLVWDVRATAVAAVVMVAAAAAAAYVPARRAASVDPLVVLRAE